MKIEDDISPMMRQYLQTKKNYEDCLLFYRLGDFYEMFFEDAKIASKVLDIALTGRNYGKSEKAPMCGVPYHSVDIYIAKLIERGYKIAICEQLSLPARGKIVHRDVVRVITPGTVIESEILDEKKNNYILSLYKKNDSIGAGFCDVSTGEFKICEFENDSLTKCIDLFSRIRPSEIICNQEMIELSREKALKALDFLPPFNKYIDFAFDLQNATEQIKKQFKLHSTLGHDFIKLSDATKAAGALISYLSETQKRPLNHINKITIERHCDFLHIDYNACKNLELVENIRDKKRKGSLLGHLNKAKTAMGARLLEKYILQPLQNPKKINERLDCLEELFYNNILLNDIQSVLSDINDIERICSKITFGSVMPRDCISLKQSFWAIQNLANLIKELKSAPFSCLFSDIESIKNLAELLEKAFIENPPNLLSNGGYIKKDFNKDLFELRQTSSQVGVWLSQLESLEKERTGIKNLKIGYNRVFGYYIEINKSQENQIPYRYQRKQTVSNYDRYITDELKEIEEKMLNAQESSIKLESSIFEKIKEQLKNLIEIIQQTASDVAFIDAVSSLALVSQQYSYVRPSISNNFKHLKIKDGRHPIVETNLKNDSFVPNDTYLDEKENRTMIITGPNMAGKSTYMRQIALITLMAHMGCFVPCSSAEIPIVDRIFTRIGANDDLSSGQSTFMVEMIEVSNILNNATSKSLVLLDEVGRGTATYDGMSIAWSVLEYISKKIKCKTLFSTHYHEITQLEGQLEGVKNYKIDVKEFNDTIVFLRKLTRGSADKSFGIEVAALSGIYEEIIKKAKSILSQLEKNTIKLNLIKTHEKESHIDKDFIINQLKQIEINKINPIEAFDILLNLTKKVR